MLICFEDTNVVHWTTSCLKNVDKMQEPQQQCVVRPCLCMFVGLSACVSACMRAASATANDAVKSAEPRAPLAEMEDIEVKTKKDKNKTTEVLEYCN